LFYTDVWAFGVVLWEIFSYGQAPYPGLSNSEVIQEVSKGYRMPPPDNCPKQIVELMNECWHDDPLKRPQWINIFVKLSALEEKYVSSGLFPLSLFSAVCLFACDAG
jgi:megakaryocyte-associated tyrosine kinase